MTATESFRIRDARPDDRATLAAYNTAMARETEGRALDPGLIERGVAALLADPAKGRYWVAESGDRVVGQIMITREWSDWRNGSLWWIQSVYVHPEFRRRGVFSALYRHVESLAREAADVAGLRLYVERDNERARQTYLALGMEEPGYRVMEVDFQKHRE